MGASKQKRQAKGLPQMQISVLGHTKGRNYKEMNKKGKRNETNNI
jgi:hypothetical protein